MEQPDLAREISWINELLEEILNTFGANEDFLNIKNYDSFDYTTPWTTEHCTQDLEYNEHYQNFISSLNEKERQSFEEFLYFDLENGTQKDLDNLYYKTINTFKEETKSKIDDIVMDLNDDKNLTSRTPSLPVINAAWEKLHLVLKQKKVLNCNINQASPTLHMIWGKDIHLLRSLNINDNFERMCTMATIFKRIMITDADTDNIGPFIKKLGFMLDLSLHKEEYLKAVELQKKHPPNKKRKPIQVANAFVYYDQQFFIPGCIERKKLYLQAHIGTDKKFKMRANDDPVIEKPEMLDPFNEEVVNQSIQLIESAKNILHTQTNTVYKKNAINEYLPKIKESMAPQTFAKLETLLKSQKPISFEEAVSIAISEEQEIKSRQEMNFRHNEKPKRCTNCQMLGHLSFQCRSKNPMIRTVQGIFKLQQSKDNGRSKDNPRDQGRVMLIDTGVSSYVTLDSRQLMKGKGTFLIDTGAEITLIKGRALKSDTEVYEDQKLKLRGIDRAAIPTETKGYTYLHFEIGGKQVYHTVSVVPDDFPIDHEGVIGNDFLQTVNAIIDYQNDTIELLGHCLKVEYNNNTLNRVESNKSPCGSC
ncbi:hypothetical protein ACJJTC_010362 [Scirpophaga incertulas]